MSTGACPRPKPAPVSWAATTSPDSDQASRLVAPTTAASPVAARNHRHRHSTTTSSAVAPTSTTPGRPAGTATVAPGIPAAQCATRNTHQSSGPVNRINNCATAGHSRHTTAAALPNTVIGAITAATARLASAPTKLTRPEMPATSGTVTTCAAQATASASANGLGQPRPTRRRDQTGATTISAAVANTDSANPTSTASCGAVAINTNTVAARAGIACRRRDDTIPANAMAPITAARSTLAVGWTTMTKPTRADAASGTASRGPSSRADNSTAPHTMVTLAPDTAVKCVRPAARKSRPVAAVTAEVSPRTKAGNIAA